MRPDNVSPHVRPVSATSWAALTGLVLLLGALGLFVMGCAGVFDLETVSSPKRPNYYVCACECTSDAETQAFAVDVRVRTLPDTNIRETPAGTIVERALDARVGTTLAGPVAADLNGASVMWWQVQFDTGAVATGWVSQAQLRVQVTVADTELAVCLPADQNANLDPTIEHADLADVTNDCSTRVQPHFAAETEPQLPAGSSCQCKATRYERTDYNAICDDECTEPYCTFPPSGQQGGAMVATTAVGEPLTAATLASGLFAPTSVCQVAGEARLSVDDQNFTTAARGVMQIHGTPCVRGEACRVGVSYELVLDDIEIPVRFHSDPKFVDLSVSGVSEPLAAELGALLPLFPDTYGGFLPQGTTDNSARGRRSGSADPARAMVGTNAADLGLVVDWVNKICLLSGEFESQVKDDDGNTATMTLRLEVGGPEPSRSVMVNQPPHANAGPDQTVECTSPQGAPVTLTASSTDPDGNLSFTVWRRGSEDGPNVAAPSTNPVVTTQQVLGETTYWTRAVDAHLTADSDDVKVTVVDSTPAVVSCNAPAMVEPPRASSKTPITFTATAQDLCGAAAARILDFECFEVKKDGRLVRKEDACEVQIQDNTISILETGGVNTVIRWRAGSTDAAGNQGAPTSCEVLVVRP